MNGSYPHGKKIFPVRIILFCGKIFIFIRFSIFAPGLVMEKSVLKHTGWLMLIVVALLLLMSLLPGATIGRYVLRRVDILGDVRPVPEVVSEPDSLLPPPPTVKPAFVDTCRGGMTCIEDYSDSTLRGMTPFYRALDELAANPRLPDRNRTPPP